MKSLLLTLLLLSTVALGTETIISGSNTTRVVDNRLIGPANAAPDTFLNKGAGVDALVGFAAGGLEYGRYLLGVNFDTIATGQIIDSVVIRLYQNTTTATTCEVTCARHQSDWKEGTADNAYQQYSSSWLCQGAGGVGTIFNGATIANADTTWKTSGFGGGNPNTTGSPITSVTSTTGYFEWRPTTQVQDSFNAGVRYISFLFYDQTYDGAQERSRFATTEAVIDTQRPKITVYHHTPVSATAEDYDTVRVLVSGATGLAATFPVKIAFTINGMASNFDYTILDEDGTTKLFWCPDSFSQNYARVWVRSGDADTLFVTNKQNGSYINCDSVFTFYEGFDGRAFSFTTHAESLEAVQRSARDTIVTNPVADVFAGTGDSVYAHLREHSNVFDDSTDPNPNRRYKLTCSVSPFGTAYSTDTNVQLAIWTSPDTKTWTHEGRILIVQPGEDPLSGDTIQMEDGFWFRWRDSTYIAFEDKQEGTMADLVGLIVSADNGLSWEYRGVIIDSSVAIDYQSPSSPVVWIENDTINVIYEGKLGSYKFGGVTYSLVAGAPFLARGTTPYNLVPISNPDTVAGDTHSPICLLGANGTFNDYGMVPHSIVIEGSTHYVNAAASEGGALDDMAWFSSTSIVDSWSEVNTIENNDAIWITAGVLGSDLDADAQIFVKDGVYYSYAMSSNDKLYRSELVKQSNTGNPNRLSFKQTPPAIQSRGFGFSQNGILSLEAEPLQPQNAVGVWSTNDSFSVNYALEAKFKIDESSIRSQGILGDPYLVLSLGSDTVINIAGSGGATWAHTTLGDGYGWQFNASSAIPFTQPLGSARSTKSPNLSLPKLNEFVEFGFGVENDSLFAGFWGSKSQGYLHDTLDAEPCKLAAFIGSTDTTGQKGYYRYGGRVLFDWIRVRPWTRPEPSGTGEHMLMPKNPPYYSSQRGGRW